ncbi:MAG: response regulator [Methanobrevibacter boviskoreani]|nr:response regulator [Methanobrevibacter boviskoreani]MCI6930483.1 response regulator [Methanobrevibacter boviskoreani]
MDLCFKLKDKGFTVYHSDDYYDALKIISDKKPDLIITDLKLKSGFVGIDIYNKFKDDGYKFIIISGTNHDKKLDDFIKSENLIFVNKPFVFEDLFDKINELLNK